MIWRVAFDLAVSASGENARYAERIRSSAGVAILVPRLEEPAHWVAAGQACQRFALGATAFGLGYAFIDQQTEVRSIRPQFAQSVGMGDRRPNLVVRFGRAPAVPRSLRRAVGDVLA